MIFSLTTKHCRVSDESLKYINSHLKKLDQFLPHIAKDLIVVRLVLRRNTDRYHPERVHHRTHKSYSDTKTELAFFEGSIGFRLNKKRLYVHFKGQTIDECIKNGFNLLFKELEKFKDLHYSSGSEYPDHSTIRKGR